MTLLYVYTNLDDTHVATITGADSLACEAKARTLYDTNDYSWTYTPAFGFSGGLRASATAINIYAD